MCDHVGMAAAMQEERDEALRAAAGNGDDLALRRLLCAGANREATNLYGVTPLYIACCNGHEACVRSLLDAGARKEVTMGDGATPLHMASQEGYAACVRALLGAGANMEAVDMSGCTPLHAACRVGHEACVRALLGAGANMEAADKDGATPLHIACEKGHAACVRALLSAGANTEAMKKGGCTPLHVACENGDEACVRALLGAGASLSAHTSNGSTPLSIARSRGYTSIVRMLDDEAAGLIPPPPSLPVARASTPAAVGEINFADLAFDGDEDVTEIELCPSGVGTVYTGRWRDERVAIKKIILPLEQVASGAFWWEVQLRMLAHHPNVVRMHGAAVKPVKGKPAEMACYVVMDRMVTDLSSALHETVDADHPAHDVVAALRPLPQRLRLLLEVARGLHFLHAQGIVHADLKPGNVMLDHAGTAQLAAFGSVVRRALDASRTGSSSHKDKRGALAYMDPALASRGEDTPLKPASDMYSWGVLAWEVLTLRKPQEGVYKVGGGGASASACAGTSSTFSSRVAIPSFSRLTFDGEPPLYPM
ncbi:MAG: hypothetical protein EOO41_01955, partial [Methanobacteriota archaeon]